MFEKIFINSPLSPKHMRSISSILSSNQTLALLSTSSSSSAKIFDKRIKRLQRDKVISSTSDCFDYLKDEVAFRVADKIFDIKRRFPVIVDLGSYKGLIGTHLTKDIVDCLIHCSSSIKSLNVIEPRSDIEIQRILMNEENFLMPENSIDLIVSSLDLHWINDLPKLFTQVNYSLKEDGVFIGSMFGGQTLYELRCSLQLAETEREGGFGLHVSPLITPQDIGSLLNRTNFTLLTIDTDEIIVHYPSIFELMYDLKGMAENNCTYRAKKHLHRDSLLAAASIYQHLYSNYSNEKNNNSQMNGIPATFQIFYFIGWKPHPSQPKPAKRGSASISIKEIPDLEKLFNHSDNDSANKS